MGQVKIAIMKEKKLKISIFIVTLFHPAPFWLAKSVALSCCKYLMPRYYTAFLFLRTRNYTTPSCLLGFVSKMSSPKKKKKSVKFS